MKLSSLLLSTGMFFALNSNAQKLTASDVPAGVKAAFEKEHPGVAGKWEKEKANYEVSFKQENKAMSCVIDEQGTILETETDIAVSKLPASVLKYVSTHYKGAKIKEGARIVKANGEVNYEAEVGKQDLVFDEHGKFIKAVKD